MIQKICPLCRETLKDDDKVVVLMLAKFKLHDESYDLECYSQTISSNLFCVEKGDMNVPK